MNKNILGDFQICISVPLSEYQPPLKIKQSLTYHLHDIQKKLNYICEFTTTNLLEGNLEKTCATWI